MKQIWKNQIGKLDILIGKISAFNIPRLLELSRKRELLEDAFNRVKG